VRQAVVVLRADNPEDPQLAAYIVAGDSEAPAPNVLRDFLKQKLPEHMVPAVYVPLDKMPLTPNGKVDRKALAGRDLERSQSQSEFVAPSTAGQKVVAGIWSQVLGIERIGVNDNFFELGGHSLLATQIVIRLRENFQIDLPVGVLFEAPTIDSLLIRMAKVWDDPAIVEDIAATIIQINELSAEEVSDLLSVEQV